MPEKVAVRLCGPAARDETSHWAVPFTTGAVPRSVAPSKKLTVPPSGRTLPTWKAETVAVRVNDWPTIAGFAELARLVVLAPATAVRLKGMAPEFPLPSVIVTITLNGEPVTVVRMPLIRPPEVIVRPVGRPVAE